MLVDRILWFLIGLSYRTITLVWHALLVVFVNRDMSFCQLPDVIDPILLKSATTLANLIRNRKLKSETLIKLYIDRIKFVNPYLNAVVDNRFELAIKDAIAADNFVQTCGKSAEHLAKEKPLLGVPFTCKNSVAVDGMILDSGILDVAGTIATKDCVAVSLMKKSGAIPLCITNVPEACMWFDASNKLYGRTKNPYDLTKIPGGSSGGESSLISSVASILGVGNDIGGSVRIPAYNCGIWAHKPTRNVISNKGQFPSTYGSGLDTFNCTGPICRYAEDLLPSLRVLAGSNSSLINLDSKVDLSKIKLYYTDDYPDNWFFSPIEKEMTDPIAKVINYMSEVHGVKAQKVKLSISANYYSSIWLSKIGSVKVANEKVLNLPIELLKMAIGYCKHTIHVLTYHFLQTYTNVNHPSVVIRNNELFTKLDLELKEILGNDGIFLTPSQPNMPYYHYDQVFRFYNIGYTGLFNILGYPVTQCPTGLHKNGLPTGLQLVSNLYKDNLTLALAAEVERGFGGWKSPFSK